MSSWKEELSDQWEYIDLVNKLIEKLDELQYFLNQLQKNDSYAEIDLLIGIYNSLFQNPAFEADIDYGLQFVSKSTYAIPPQELNRDNSYYHLTLKMKSAKMIWLDELYDGRITGIIRFFKYLFSTIDNFYIIRNENKLIQYKTLITSLRKELSVFTRISRNELKELPFVVAQRQKDQILLRDNLDNGTIIYKDEAAELANIIAAKHITSLYHFTDESNVESIKTSGFIFSWWYCVQHEISISRPGGNVYSRKFDQSRFLENYVRASFCPDHPMKFAAVRDMRISKPVMLQIDPEVILWAGSLYSDRNATATGAKIGGLAKDLSAVKFNVIAKGNYRSLPQEEKPFYQAEVLILERIPIRFITNIEH